MLFGFSDNDFDGVDDSVDKCPNTSITDLVDENGCSIKSVMTEQYFDIIFGVSYSQLNYISNRETDTIATDVQIDYYYENFTLQFQSSYLESDTSLSLYLYYSFDVTSDLTLETGVGVILPTYDSDYRDDNRDYSASLNLNYLLGEWSFFAGYNYIFVDDSNVIDAFIFGIGYDFTQKLNVSVSYYQSDSIYSGVEVIKSISLYGFYSIDSNWFTMISYAKGLTDSTSDNYVELRVGYYF